MSHAERSCAHGDQIRAMGAPVLRELRELGPTLATAVELRLLAQQVQNLTVRRAREQGWSWAQIAAALGTPGKQLRAT